MLKYLNFFQSPLENTNIKKVNGNVDESNDRRSTGIDKSMRRYAYSQTYQHHATLAHNSTDPTATNFFYFLRRKAKKFWQ